MVPDTPECHAVYDRAREIFYTHFAHLFAEKGGPIYREEVPYEGGVLPCWRVLPDGASKGTILFHGGNDSLLGGVHRRPAVFGPRRLYSAGL